VRYLTLIGAESHMNFFCSLINFDEKKSCLVQLDRLIIECSWFDANLFSVFEDSDWFVFHEEFYWLGLYKGFLVGDEEKLKGILSVNIFPMIKTYKDYFVFVYPID